MQEKEFISKINLFRIVFALMIVIGHTSMHFEKELLPLWLIHKFNMVGVCYFFFTSGVSCAYSYTRKNSHIEKYCLRKIFSLLLVMGICLVVTIGIEGIYADNFRNIQYNLRYIYQKINWYIWVQLLFYIVFGISYKWIYNRKNRVLCLIVFAIVQMILAYELNLSHAYCYSSMGFPMGIFFHEYYDEIRQYRAKKSGGGITLLLIIIALLSCICLILPENIVTVIIMRNTMCCSTILLFAFFLLSSVSNRLVAKLEWLQKANVYSLEIYLYQFVFLQLIDELFRLQNRMIDMSYVIGVMMLTVVIAYFMQPIDKKILRYITKK